MGECFCLTKRLLLGGSADLLVGRNDDEARASTRRSQDPSDPWKSLL